MKFVIQAVNSAELFIENTYISKISKGMVVYVGFKENDNLSQIELNINKIINLRIFKDENKKCNFNVNDFDGEILLIPNFTLYANCNHGYRPDFFNAMNYDNAKVFFNKTCEFASNLLKKRVKFGVFGANMQIMESVDGPMNIVIEN